MLEEEVEVLQVGFEKGVWTKPFLEWRFLMKIEDSKVSVEVSF